jgi:hypothetical protein
MFVQMQLNPQQPDPVQQKIFTWMPVIFTYMLASFPSGLVIYWAWNNVLSLVQQYTIMRRNNTEVHLWKNLGVDRWKTRLAQTRDLDFGTLGRQVTTTTAPLLRSLGRLIGPRSAEHTDGRPPAMTRDEALTALGLAPGASEREIDAALEEEVRRRRRAEVGKGDKAVNGPEQAKLDAARETLRGKVP